MFASYRPELLCQSPAQDKCEVIWTDSAIFKSPKLWRANNLTEPVLNVVASLHISSHSIAEAVLEFSMMPNPLLFITETMESAGKFTMRFGKCWSSMICFSPLKLNNLIVKR